MSGIISKIVSRTSIKPLARKTSTYTLAARGAKRPEATSNVLILCAGLAASAAIGISYYRNNKRSTDRASFFAQDEIDRRDPDFTSLRVPLYARKFTESPCAESFQNAYKCALFNENCTDIFVEFFNCLKENPDMLKPDLPNGETNFNSKIFLQRLQENLDELPDALASIGEPTVDFEQVLNEYKAKEQLTKEGQEITPAKIEQKVKHYNTVMANFKEALKQQLENPLTNPLKIDKLFKQLQNECGMTLTVFLDALKDTDVDMFDEYMTNFRDSYKFVLEKNVEDLKLPELLDADLTKTECGEQFSNIYKCLKKTGDFDSCVEFIDKLCFCRATKTKLVLPTLVQMYQQDDTISKERDRIYRLARILP